MKDARVMTCSNRKRLFLGVHEQLLLDAPGLSGRVSRWWLITELMKLLWMPRARPVEVHVCC